MAEKTFTHAELLNMIEESNIRSSELKQDLVRIKSSGFRWNLFTLLKVVNWNIYLVETNIEIQDNKSKKVAHMYSPRSIWMIQHLERLYSIRTNLINRIITHPNYVPGYDEASKLTYTKEQSQPPVVWKSLYQIVNLFKITTTQLDNKKNSHVSKYNSINNS